MKVAMLTTVGDRCGIAAYSRDLTAGLQGLVDLEVEPIEVGKQPVEHYEDQAGRLNSADVIHIQHEHSFWGGILPGQSAFWTLRYLLQKPVVITAHTTTSLADLQRVKQERKDFFEKYGPEARQILDDLLEKYAQHGDAQFVLPDVLRVPPISEHGQPGEIICLFGGPEQLREAVNELQVILYGS